MPFTVDNAGIANGAIVTTSGTVSSGGITIGTSGGIIYKVGAGSIGFSNATTQCAQFSSQVQLLGHESNKLLVKSAISNSQALQFWQNSSTGDLSVLGSGNVNLNIGTNAATQILISNAGAITLGANAATQQHALNTLVKTNGVAAGTLTNAPSAGNPTGFIQISVNGATSYIPYWQ